MLFESNVESMGINCEERRIQVEFKLNQHFVLERLAQKYVKLNFDLQKDQESFDLIVNGFRSIDSQILR